MTDPDLAACLVHLRAAQHHHEVAMENARLAQEAAERAAQAQREGDQ